MEGAYSPRTPAGKGTLASLGIQVTMAYLEETDETVSRVTKETQEIQDILVAQGKMDFVERKENQEQMEELKQKASKVIQAPEDLQGNMAQRDPLVRQESKGCRERLALRGRRGRKARWAPLDPKD